ncbi:MAG: amidohydrolase family protein [Pseudomonadota bacterium]
MFGRDPVDVITELEWLEAEGFETVVVFPLPGLGASPEKVFDMIPGAYQELTGLNTARTANDDLQSWLDFDRRWRARPRKMKVLSFLDVRGWDGNTDLAVWWGDGHAGLKSIIIEEEDGAKMRMPPLRRVPGLSRADYLDAQRAVFEASSRLNVPLVYHADLSLHSGFVEECLQAHPLLRVNVPHFGFSRKRMAGLLDRYDGLMTDISSLGPHIDTAPASYRDFILDYPDRVMLGSDAIASHDMRLGMAYVERVRKLRLPPDIEAGVLMENARRFLYGGGDEKHLHTGSAAYGKGATEILLPR